MGSRPKVGSRLSSFQPGVAKTSGSDAGRHWQVLLRELVHLLGLFLFQSRQTREASGADALFDQVVRHLEIISKMPGHDGGILIRRTTCGLDAESGFPDYLALFGDVIIHGRPGADEISAPAGSQLESASSKAFGYLADMGIHSIYLQIPELSAEKIEQLRLSMNIVARFNQVVDGGASLAFRYKGRTVTVPVICDNGGHPDLNLTLVAALNGLSAVNARELVKQAAAYQSMQTTTHASAQPDHSASNTYNQIFNVRSLRSQVLKPPVEINNIPWVPQPPAFGGRPGNADDSKRPKGSDRTPAGGCGDGRQAALKKRSSPPQRGGPDWNPELTRKSIQSHIDPSDEAAGHALDMIFDSDFNALEPPDLAEQLVAITRLLYSLDKKCQGSGVVDGVLDYLRYRLADLPDRVLSSIEAKRQGLKIDHSGRSLLIGLVHPRLLDLISLIKERIDVQHRTAIIKEIAFNFDHCHTSALADGFQLSFNEALPILNMLKGCFGPNGAFLRPPFEKQMDIAARHGNAIFEILWCVLKMAPRRKDRLDLLNAIQLLMADLKDAKRALQFLMADAGQIPSAVRYTDRNAFALANILLHTEKKERYVDIRRTPEDVLTNQRGLDQRLKHYSAWRLGVDQCQFLRKAGTLRQHIEDSLAVPQGGHPGPYEATFLLALEREIFIFCALVGGQTARIVLREAIDQYGNADSPIFKQNLNFHDLSNILDHLQVAVRAMGRAGHSSDMERLKALEKNAKAIGDLNAHPAHKLHVKQAMKWVPKALRAIQIQGH